MKSIHHTGEGWIVHSITSIPVYMILGNVPCAFGTVEPIIRDQDEFRTLALLRGRKLAVARQ